MHESAMQGVKSATVEAVITRADGTVESLGVVARYDAPGPIKRAFEAVRSAMARVFS